MISSVVEWQLQENSIYGMPSSYSVVLCKFIRLSNVFQSCTSILSQYRSIHKRASFEQREKVRRETLHNTLLERRLELCILTPGGRRPTRASASTGTIGIYWAIRF